MDLDADKDLFWIAREGLKAPLPNPWKPCQTREGDIYYFNFETGESTWEHPCDEYYRKMYEKEKKKKLEKENEKRKSKESKEKQAYENYASYSSQSEKTKSLQATKKSSPVKTEPVTLSELQKEKKLNDPILRAEYEKKVKAYREQKEEELKSKKQELTKQYEDLRKELDKNHENKLSNLNKKYEELKKTEKNKLIEDMKPLDETEMPKEKSKYTEEVKKELEKNMMTKIKLYKDELYMEISNIKNNYQMKKIEKIKELSDKIGREYKSELDGLEVELSRLRAASLSARGKSESNDYDLEQSIKKSFINDQEIKFQLEKDTLVKKILDQTRVLKAKEEQKYQEQIKALYAEFENTGDNSADIEETKYKLSLENEFKNQIEEFKKQLNRKFEILKLNSLEKLKDYEKLKMDAFRASLHTELDFLETDFNKEKEDLEKKFQQG
mgnify:CR=1 FL=1